jgi:serine/threonine-protein kinase
VVVDDDGRVRLLDFGIARLHEPGSVAARERTATAMRALTPEYAAPEQLAGAAPTTAMDVYGIGALLYRLLSGAVPRDAAGREVIRRVGDSDLQAVIAKALAAEPERRYGGVEALADDLQRWLDGKTVRAQPPTLRYRLRTFVSRNRVAVGATLAVLLALAAGMATTAWQARQAREQAALARLNAARAEQQAGRAILVRDFLGDVFGSTEPSTGTVPDALDLLAEGARRARELRQQDPRAAADILLITGGARIALSDFDPAESDLLLALQLLGRDRPLPAKALAEAHWDLGRLYKQRGPPDKAIDHFRAAQDWAARAGETPEQRLVYDVSLASALSLGGQAAEAETLLRAALERIPPELRGTRAHLDALNALGTALSMQDAAPDEQLALHEQRLEAARKLYGENNGWYAYTLADAVPTLRRFDEYLARAVEVGREAVSISDRIYARPHLVAAVANCNLAYALQDTNALDEALHYFDRAMVIDEALQRSDPHAESCRYGRARARLHAGDLTGAAADLAADRRMLEAMGEPRSRAWLNHCLLDARIRRARDQRAPLEPFLQACEQARAPGDGPSTAYVAARDAFLEAAP